MGSMIHRGRAATATFHPRRRGAAKSRSQAHAAEQQVDGATIRRCTQVMQVTGRGEEALLAAVEGCRAKVGAAEEVLLVPQALPTVTQGTAARATASAATGRGRGLGGAPKVRPLQQRPHGLEVQLQEDGHILLQGMQRCGQLRLRRTQTRSPSQQGRERPPVQCSRLAPSMRQRLQLARSQLLQLTELGLRRERPETRLCEVPLDASKESLPTRIGTAGEKAECVEQDQDTEGHEPDAGAEEELRSQVACLPKEGLPEVRELRPHVHQELHKRGAAPEQGGGPELHVQRALQRLEAELLQSLEAQSQTQGAHCSRGNEGGQQ
mmetsp:Transcript_71095/g.159672  ORF Transcript_71095/g.159672 Transcript_71095/m.159672 type:complete len:323 (-) Transcript_71095:894-1862(-)